MDTTFPVSPFDLLFLAAVPLSVLTMVPVWNTQDEEFSSFEENPLFTKFGFICFVGGWEHPVNTFLLPRTPIQFLSTLDQTSKASFHRNQTQHITIWWWYQIRRCMQWWKCLFLLYICTFLYLPYTVYILYLGVMKFFMMTWLCMFHIRSTHSLHDQIYEFYELMGIHAYMNNKDMNTSFFIMQWICWSHVKISFIVLFITTITCINSLLLKPASI